MKCQGSFPDPTWKRIHVSENWSTGDTYIATIGQGYVLSTPLQVLVSFATIANDGVMMKPTLVKDILSPEGEVIQTITPTVVWDITKDNVINEIVDNEATGNTKNVEPWVIDLIKEGMRMVSHRRHCQGGIRRVSTSMRPAKPELQNIAITLPSHLTFASPATGRRMPGSSDMPPMTTPRSWWSHLCITDAKAPRLQHPSSVKSSKPTSSSNRSMPPPVASDPASTIQETPSAIMEPGDNKMSVELKSPIQIKGIREGLLINLGGDSFQDAQQQLLDHIDHQTAFFRGARLALDTGGMKINAGDLGSLRDKLSERGVSLWAVLSARKCH